MFIHRFNRLSLVITLLLSIWFTGTIICHADEPPAEVTEGWTRLGTCEWKIDGEGLLTLRPAGNGDAGTLPKIENSPWESNAALKKAYVAPGVKAGTRLTLFRYCRNLGSIEGLENLDTSDTTSMAGMFQETSIKAIDISVLDTSKVQYMSFMFEKCSELETINLEHLDTSSLRYANNMLSGVGYNVEDITINWNGLDLSGVDANQMCAGMGAKEIDFSDVKTDSNTNLKSAFNNCSNLVKANMKGLKGSDYSYMFWNCWNLTTVDFTGADFTSQSQDHMFYSCSNLVRIPDGFEFTGSGNNVFYAIGETIPTLYEGCDPNIINHNWLDENRILNSIAIHKWNEEYTVDKEATCTEEGSKSKHCSVCNAIDESTVEAIQKTEHKYGDWKVTKEATCTEDGSKEKVCEVCEDKVTEAIPATGHKWNDEYTVDKEASCTEEGSKSKHCTKCDAIDESSITVMPALGHDWDSGKITTEPTCTDEGVKTFACNRCEETKTEVVPATGHSFSDEFTTDTEPTCTTEGSKSKHCTKCEAVTEVTAIPANGHAFGPWEVVTPSTCEGAGSHQHSCEVCGFTEAEATDPTGHDIEENYTIDVPATCTTDGSQSKHCKNCEVTFDSQVIPATGHSYGEWKTTLEPTCTEKGSKEQICSTCKDKVTEEIPVLGHAWNEEPTVDKAATCTEVGSQSIHCARCDEIKDAEEIPALGHKWNDDYTVDKAATTSAAGTKSIHCSVCDAIKEGSSVTIDKLLPADPANGTTVSVPDGTIIVTSAISKTVAYAAAPNKKTVTVPDTVTVNGKIYAVTEIDTKAFAGRKIRTVTIGKNVRKIKKNTFKGTGVTKLIVKTKKLTKKSSVKGSLKGSKVKTVQVKVGKKSLNKKYVKKYKKVFTKKNVGKKVKIR